ncbi:putative LmbE-like protein [Frankia canadensis]|uniref:Putative LmbE-like protein n=2 Tax=Frankia canadensis TaxID=1836972 RepID=A0A2I2KX17_9ACTN|nr:putative LmbE-like protein [Frankia canadensis]SOU57501.1 putative LmbE-like protein [Frankia canadensis]
MTMTTAWQSVRRDPRTAKSEVMVLARSAFRWAWTRRGTDLTAAMARSSCLVVAPHPDDETLGCAVAVMRKRAVGTPVTIVIVSDGARAEPVTLPPAELVEVRAGETRRACAALGVGETDVLFLGFPDSELGEHLDAIAGRLSEIIRARGPAQILVPTSCEGHPDHDATHEAARRAVAATGFAGQVLEYTVWLWTHWPWTRGYGTRDRSVSRLLVEPFRRLGDARPLLVDARGLRTRQRRALAEHVTQVGAGDPGGAPSAGGAAGEDAGTPVTGPLLATLQSRYEVYVQAGALRHLDFPRPWRSSGPVGATTERRARPGASG